MDKQKKNNTPSLPIFHESFTQEENAAINEYIKSSSALELATTLNTVCTELIAPSVENFLPFYLRQLSILELKIKATNEIAYQKKYKKHLYKLIEAETFEILRPGFLEAFIDYKNLTGLSREFVEQSFIDKTASELIEKLKQSGNETDKYTEYLNNKFGTNNYVSHDVFIKLLRKPKVPKTLDKPVYKDPRLDNAEILETMGIKLLQSLLIKMIALLDNEKISNAYPILLFTVASFCYSSSHHGTSKSSSYDGKNLRDLIAIKNELKKENNDLEALLKEILERK